MKKFIPLLILGLVGCSVFKDHSPNDVRSQENIRETRTFNMSIQDIDSAIKQYNSKCKNIPNLVISPVSPNKASAIYSQPGIHESSTFLVIDFEQTDKGTTAKGYTMFGGAWTTRVSNYLNAITNPNSC
jgi:hypothetical protein